MLKYANSILVFWTFKPNVIKIDPYNFELTVSKLSWCVFWHSVYAFNVRKHYHGNSNVQSVSNILKTVKITQGWLAHHHMTWVTLCRWMLSPFHYTCWFWCISDYILLWLTHCINYTYIYTCGFIHQNLTHWIIWSIYLAQIRYLSWLFYEPSIQRRNFVVGAPTPGPPWDSGVDLGMCGPIDQKYWLREAVCLKHGRELSLKSLTVDTSFVWKWTVAMGKLWRITLQLVNTENYLWRKEERKNTILWVDVLLLIFNIVHELIKKWQLWYCFKNQAVKAGAPLWSGARWQCLRLPPIVN